MTSQEAKLLMEQLLETIQAERRYAVALDLDGLAEATRKKETLLGALSPLTQLPPDLKPLARRIKQENLRNAFLYKTTLNWIQGLMEFFGKKTVPATYGQQGVQQHVPVHGRLLSGRI